MKPSLGDLLFPVFMVLVVIGIGSLVGMFFSGCAHIDSRDRYCRNTAGLRYGGRCDQDGHFRIMETK